MPGVKRPCGLACEERDSAEVDDPAARGVLTATVWVAKASDAAAAPHAAQYRLPSAISAPHDRHWPISTV
jgi:hypothetical protein